jgi:hypothetical protein
MRTAIAISMTPITLETRCTLNRPYTHDISGLCATNGWMPAASPGVNFNTPISNKTATNPYRETQIPTVPSLDWMRLDVIPSNARSISALTMSIPSSQEMPYALPQILQTYWIDFVWITPNDSHHCSF